jgi:hypothetical protein
MTRRLVCLALLECTACLDLSDLGDPDAPTRRLSELPPPQLMLAANSRSVGVTFGFDPVAIGACPVLDDGFEATVNGTRMTITERGASLGSIYADACGWPELHLDNPPVALAATIEMHYPGHTITVDLADLLAPRSATLVPDGPWTFKPGQQITLQWSRSEDFATYTPRIAFRKDLSDNLPVTVVDDRMSFMLPTVATAGTLEIAMKLPDVRPHGGFGIDWPPCAGAWCQLVQTPQVIQPIAFQP